MVAVGPASEHDQFGEFQSGAQHLTNRGVLRNADRLQETAIEIRAGWGPVAAASD